MPPPPGCMKNPRKPQALTRNGTLKNPEPQTLTLKGTLTKPDTVDSFHRLAKPDRLDDSILLEKKGALTLGIGSWGILY